MSLQTIITCFELWSQLLAKHQIYSSKSHTTLESLENKLYELYMNYLVLDLFDNSNITNGYNSLIHMIQTYKIRQNNNNDIITSYNDLANNFSGRNILTRSKNNSRSGIWF